MMKLNRVVLATDGKVCQDRGNALFLDRVRLAHLGTEATVQAEAEDPRSLAIAHLPVTSTALRSVCTRDGGSPMQVQVRGHPEKASANQHQAFVNRVVASLDAQRGFGVPEMARKVRT